MFADINQTLLRHLATSNGAAYNLRARNPHLVGDAQAFFSARNDIKRLDAAQTLAADILLENDFVELVALRDIVAQQELRRQIKYPRQKDHTTHTVSLYLLGVWLYDNLPKFQFSFASKIGLARELTIIKGSKPSIITDTIDHEFLFQWVFASLLHDVGYVFFDLSAETADDRKAIGALFSWERVKACYSNLSTDCEKALRSAFTDWDHRFSSTDISPLSSANTPSDILQWLASAPWLDDIVPSTAGRDLFEVLELNDLPLLRKYASHVAENGYAPIGNFENACVDHAVGSALLLLRYTAFWYWLLKHVAENASDCLVPLTGRFNYDPQNMTSSIIPACRAVAFHNIRPTVPCATEIIPLITLSSEPLMFLSILCDELQIWDRPPAGVEDLKSYRAYAKSALDGSDVQIVCNGPTDFARAFFTIRASAEVQPTIKKKLRTTLDDRLPGWKELIELT
jgi:hypothetical protein